MAVSRRDHLVDTALELFHRDGFHATGIDRILAESGVAKMTLYKHFKSKDELILAALRRRDERFRNWLMREIERLDKTPRGRLLAVFDALAAYCEMLHFGGCFFVNAAAEYGSREDPIHVAAAEHKRLVFTYVRGLAAAAGAADADTLARQITLLMEGAIVTAYVAGIADTAGQAKDAAQILIAAAIPPASSAV